jgi:hypothetical protein
MAVVKVQDVGSAPLRGRQEEYWNYRINPKYQKYRPGYKFIYKPEAEILKASNLKALEFGHYTTQYERFDFLACSDVSFSDIKKVTGFKDIGFGTIGLAYGARGMGGFAVAHFEPSSFMINLTRKSGFGAFAHEYGHAIDYFFGGYIDQIPGCFSLSGGHSISTKKLNQSIPDSLRFLMDNVMEAVIWKNAKEHTDMYNYLKRTKDPGGYWFRRTELFARAFEKYVHYKLNKKGIKNEFLLHTKYESGNYLSSNDFIKVLPRMERLIKKMALNSRE